MNVLNKMGRKILFVSLGVVMAAGVSLSAPVTPTAGACYNGNNCGGGYGWNQCPPWQEWRTDNPGNPWGGCVDTTQRYDVWHCVNGEWRLDPPWLVYGYNYNDGWPNY